MPIHKQISIKKAFKRAQVLQSDDSDHLREEIQLLEQQLKEKQNEWFELQKESYRRKIPKAKKKYASEINLPLAQTEIILTKNKVQKLKDAIFIISMLSGMEVQSFKENDHCSVVFHMQHTSENMLKHGLKIDLRNGKEQISESSLPLGFNLFTAMEDYNSVMTPECLGAIRNALITYYDRLNQFEQLKKSLFMDALLFKTLDTSHIEITFKVYNERDPDEGTTRVVLVMEYRVHDTRPKQCNIKHTDGPEHTEEILLQQCVVFKKKPLLKAFNEAFITGVGPYKLVGEEIPKSPKRRPRHRARHHGAAGYNNDDTFRPEECSDTGDDEDEEL
ncbi:hypothetical protein K1T71_003522 [Dendrolimus kikuchii]|uniref:Uncharacterized protein n=1 Tax=Dendrolimus kikuchii TaxID=765133 RepID=A0ACC1DCU6_9NEOP|nr:hypothetical protein K1T71_003522 [Dendrolimus kikuchii]